MISRAMTIAACWDQLLAKSSSVEMPGYLPNEFGEFEYPELRRQLVQLYDAEIRASQDASERLALMFSLASLYKRSLLLDEAKTTIEFALREAEGARSVPFRNLLVRVLAMEGNLDRACGMLDEVNSMAISPMWRLTPETLREEAQKQILLVRAKSVNS